MICYSYFQPNLGTAQGVVEYRGEKFCSTVNGNRANEDLRCVAVETERKTERF